MKVDFRSDTVTKPSAEMLAMMMQAPVGDDVYGEDPTVNQLESYAAQLFGMEAAIYCASGTMTNQIGIKVHTQPGEEVICEVNSHIYQYEGGGIALNSGAQVQLIHGQFGKITAEDVRNAIHSTTDIHQALTSLVSLENTTNRGGGACYDIATLQEIKQVCKENNLALHLDGARLFNAMIATQTSAKQYGEIFDTISICLSKGLGAPVGSLLLGSAKHIQKARRIRKYMGGGMRQAGYIAAAGLYALQNNIGRLAIDHIHAQTIAECLKGLPFIESILPVETNIVIARLNSNFTPSNIITTLKDQGILINAMGKNAIRFVTHLDINASQIDYTVEVLKQLK